MTCLVSLFSLGSLDILGWSTYYSNSHCFSYHVSSLITFGHLIPTILEIIYYVIAFLAVYVRVSSGFSLSAFNADLMLMLQQIFHICTLEALHANCCMISHSLVPSVVVTSLKICACAGFGGMFVQVRLTASEMRRFQGMVQVQASYRKASTKDDPQTEFSRVL